MSFCCYSCNEKWTRYENKQEQMLHFKFVPLLLGTNMQRCGRNVVASQSLTKSYTPCSTISRYKFTQQSPQSASFIGDAATSCRTKLWRGKMQQKCTCNSARIVFVSKRISPMRELPPKPLFFAVNWVINVVVVDGDLHICQSYKLAKLMCVASSIFFGEQKKNIERGIPTMMMHLMCRENRAADSAITDSSLYRVATLHSWLTLKFRQMYICMYALNKCLPSQLLLVLLIGKFHTFVCLIVSCRLVGQMQQQVLAAYRHFSAHDIHTYVQYICS